MSRSEKWHESDPSPNLFRGFEFWRRASGIYMSYKITQLRANLLRAAGKKDEWITKNVWKPHNEVTGQRMYDLCVDLRGFYLKGGQFLGTRVDFIPEEVCRQLSKLHDQVPPMPAKKVESILKKELGVDHLSDIFEEIDLNNPLGSASIAQVHKGRLKPVSLPPLYRIFSFFGFHKKQSYFIQEGEQAWDVCKKFGIGFHELARANKGVDLSNLSASMTLNVPVIKGINQSNEQSKEAILQQRVNAARHAMLHKDRPMNGIVAIKVQYPNALEIMKQDLANIRTWANFLSKTEIQFDMVSAVDELRKQIELEFDFTREARVMDSIALALQPLKNDVEIPQSIPGLVTERLLVMSFVDGIPLRSLGDHTAHLSQRKQLLAKEKILKRLCKVYGKMIFGTGLFQADGHPGNILVQKGARIGLLDYGQSKKLTKEEIGAFAHLISAMAQEQTDEICLALDDLGIEMGSTNPALKQRMAYGMFDTRGTVNPFSKDSPLKICPVSNFPPDLFFVLRVIQLIRCIKQAMQIDINFSCARHWSQFAKRAQRNYKEL